LSVIVHLVIVLKPEGGTDFIVTREDRLAAARLVEGTPAFSTLPQSRCHFSELSDLKVAA
jgi:hypothetical protein